MFKKIALLSTIGGILLAGSAQADTIIQFFQGSGSAHDFTLNDTGTENTFVTTGGPVTITMQTDSSTDGVDGTDITATLVITGDSSTTPGSIAGSGQLTQTGYQNGFFEIVGTGAFAYLNVATAGCADHVIICGTFGSAGASTGLSGTAAGTSATFSSSDTVADPNEVSFFSTYWTLSTNQALGLSLSGLTSDLSLAASTNLTNAFQASGTGTFSADLPGAPEPGTLALFGSALVGLGLLGRKRIRR